MRKILRNTALLAAVFMLLYCLKPAYAMWPTAEGKSAYYGEPATAPAWGNQSVTMGTSSLDYSDIYYFHTYKEAAELALVNAPTDEYGTVTQEVNYCLYAVTYMEFSPDSGLESGLQYFFVRTDISTGYEPDGGSLGITDKAGLAALGMTVPDYPSEKDLLDKYNKVHGSQEPPTQSEGEAVPEPAPEPEAEKVDKSALESLYGKIMDATGGKRGEYTVDSWQQLISASQNAVNVDNNLNATQEQVNTALSSLASAWSSMELMDRTKLKELIDNSEMSYDDQGNYSDESWEKYTEALAEAKATYNLKETTQADIDKALNRLKNAVNELKEIDREKLKAMISLANHYFKYGGGEDLFFYPYLAPDSLQNMQAYIQKAENVLNDDSVTSQQVIDDARDELYGSIKSLKLNAENKLNWSNEEFTKNWLKEYVREKLDGEVNDYDPVVEKAADLATERFPELKAVFDLMKIASAAPKKDEIGIDERTFDTLDSLIDNATGETPILSDYAKEVVKNTARSLAFAGSRVQRLELAKKAGITDIDELLLIAYGPGNYRVQDD